MRRGVIYGDCSEDGFVRIVRDEGHVGEEGGFRMGGQGWRD
jgi:hypothetical protein